jgi:hypothetical protein
MWKLILESCVTSWAPCLLRKFGVVGLRRSLQCHSEERSDEESTYYLFREGQKHKADPSLRSG